MNWHNLLKTVCVVGIGLGSFSVFSVANAETSDGPAVIITHESDVTADAQPETAAQDAAETAEIETPAKPTKKTAEKKKPEAKPTETKQAHAKTEDAQEDQAEAEDQEKPQPKKTTARIKPDPKAKEPMKADEKETASKKPQQEEAAASASTDIEEPVAAAEEEGQPASTKGSRAQKQAALARTLRPLIERHAASNNLPSSLVDAVVRLESGYNAGARNGPNIGLTQINAATARSLGYQGDTSGLMDADTNLRYGVKYLAMAHKLAKGDTCGTILRYQFGHRTETMTAASRKYCAKVKVITADAD